jgi:hypothetical protein
MHGDIDAGCLAERAGAIVELGGDGELAVARPFGDDRCRTDRDERARKLRGIVDPALCRREIIVDRIGHREAALRSEGEGDQLQAAILQRLSEGAGLCGVVADHRIGDFDARITAGGNCRKQVVRRSGPGLAEHLPCKRLAADLQIASHVTIP